MREKVSILGTSYDITIDRTKSNKKLADANAYIEFYTKKIVVDVTEISDNTVENVEEAICNSVRHEVIHGFLWESGMRRYAYDETIVDWISVQLYKIVEACRHAEKSALDIGAISE